MMIPGQWEPRPSRANVAAAPVSAPPPAVAAAGQTATARTARREMATWVEVSIAVAVLVGVMVIAMWASRAGSPVGDGPDRSEDVAAPVQHIVAAQARCRYRVESERIIITSVDGLVVAVT
jgi:hypothetical protein